MTTTMFADRLDFLMRLTNTQNSALARALNFDASYISRIRSGRRGMPRHQPFVEPAAAYFAARLSEPYQCKAMADAICLGREWPDDIEASAALIENWLEGDDIVGNPIDQLLENIMAVSRRRETFAAAPNPTTAAPEMGSFYYGDEGKRAAVEALLAMLLELDTPIELLLFSDECMTWLYDDPEFEERWASLLEIIAARGGHIRIVHTIARDLNQMMGAVSGWLPLYMTGAIEPWWYPGVRDGIYRRTLLIARGHAAIVSSSIGDSTKGMLNIVVRDPEAIAALELEYAHYLELCRPLMQFETLTDTESFVRWLRKMSSDVRDSNEDVMIADVGSGAFALLVSAGTSATLFRKDLPATIASVKEHSLAASFWEYLMLTNSAIGGRDAVADRLEQIADQQG